MWDKNSSMNKPNQIMYVSLPVAEAADLMTRAAARGMPAPDYLGLLVLSAAYGVSHPIVAGAAKLPKVGVYGPKMKGEKE